MADSEPGETRELLDVNSKPQYPSCLLMKKRPQDLDPDARAAELKKLKKSGSDILDRMRQFIPVMKESERLLQERIEQTENKDDLDMEKVEEGQSAVEIDIALFEYNSDSEQNAEADATGDSSDLTDEEDEGQVCEILRSVQK